MIQTKPNLFHLQKNAFIPISHGAHCETHTIDTNYWLQLEPVWPELYPETEFWLYGTEIWNLLLYMYSFFNSTYRFDLNF